MIQYRWLLSEPVKLTNQTQISEKAVQTSGTAEAVDWAGRKSSQAYQLAKRAKEIKRDMELMLTGETVKAAGAAGVARATAACMTWMGTAVAGTSNLVDGSAAGVQLHCKCWYWHECCSSCWC